MTIGICLLLTYTVTAAKNVSDSAFLRYFSCSYFLTVCISRFFYLPVVVVVLIKFVLSHAPVRIQHFLENGDGVQGSFALGDDDGDKKMGCMVTNGTVRTRR